MKTLHAVIPRQTVAKVTISDTPFPVTILESKDNTIVVEVSGNKNATQSISLESNDNRVRIFGPESASTGNVSIKGNNNISISNSSSTQITIGGVIMSDYTTGSETIEKIDIYIPKGSELICSGSQKNIKINVDLKKLTLNLTSTCEFEVTEGVAEAELNLFNQVNGVIRNMKDGQLTVNTFGQSFVSISGSFSKVVVDASNQSSISTSGPVTGDYTVTTSRKASVCHTGIIHGTVNDTDCAEESPFQKN